MSCPMQCVPCTGKLEPTAAPAWLDQCCLTRLPARDHTCTKRQDVLVTLPTGEPWSAYPAASPQSKGATT